MADWRDEMARIRAALEQADTALVAALDARARAIRDFVTLRDRDPSGYHTLPQSAEVLARARESRGREAGRWPAHGLEPVFREVLGVCAEMIAPVIVAVHGPEAALGHLAARRWFGSRAQIRPHATVAEVFTEVECGRMASGVVPYESSSDGTVAATLSALTDTSAKVIGELSVLNTWALYSRSGKLDDIKSVYGAAIALAACERTLKSELPSASIIDVRSAAAAASKALEDGTAAALGTVVLPELAPELKIARTHIEDEPGISTRFLVLGHQQPRRTGSDRTMLVLALVEAPGSLYAALAPFADRGINLARLESRPSRTSPWHDVVFIELDGHVSDRSLLTAIEDVKARARHVKVLGSYPRPEPVGVS